MDVTGWTIDWKNVAIGVTSLGMALIGIYAAFLKLRDSRTTKDRKDTRDNQNYLDRRAERALKQADKANQDLSKLCLKLRDELAECRAELALAEIEREQARKAGGRGDL